MTTDDIVIRPMERTPEEVRKAVACVVGGGWGTYRQYHSMFTFYATNPNCWPFVAVDGGAVVGTGIGTRYQMSGWVGHVFVSPRLRGSGLGRRLTETAIARLRELGCETIVLAATVLGRPLYEGLGFEFETDYHELRGQALPKTTSLDPLRPLMPSDRRELARLDRIVSGERRGNLLTLFSGYGWCLERDQAVVGAVLPTPWGGVQASLLPDASGAETAALIRAIRTLGGIQNEVVVYPTTENVAALRMLADQGFEEKRRVPRMVLGERLGWLRAAVWSPFALGLG